MNWYNKETTSAVLTLLTFMLILAICTGEYVSLIKGLGVAVGVFGAFWVTWRGYFRILDKLFPENKSKSIGTKTTVVNFKYE